MNKSLFKTLVLTSSVVMAFHSGVNAAPAVGVSVSSQQQGMHQWQLPKGKLILINGSYQDVTTYKRSLTFYFEDKPGSAWLHVPLINSDTDQDLTWFSISQGEQTVSDAVVVPHAGSVELVIASTRPGALAAVAVRRYRLAEYSDDNPYGPAHYFKKISAASYPSSAKLTVEQVLEKEGVSRLKK
jgi:hypothetical protein